MKTISTLLALASLLTACAVDDDAELGSTEQEGSAYRPMGFARVNADATLSSGFNTAAGAVTIAHPIAGRYTVTFPGLGTASTVGGARGNVQLTAHGTTNTRCIVERWTSAPTNVGVEVRCSDTAGTLTDTAFAVLYVRDTVWPAVPNTLPTRMAYAYVSSSGIVPSSENFNSSGTPNTAVWETGGRAIVTVPNATGDHASIMVSAHQGIFAGTHTCSLVSWIGNKATVECRTPTGSPVNNGFAFLYARSGPPVEQQGAHALFNGTSVDATRSSALGKYAWCSPASVTGGRKDSLASILVEGDLGPWDASPFLRASFATRQSSGGGFCKIESLTTTGIAPATRSTTTVRCYTATGAIVPAPVFRFTHVTSDPSGPC